MKEVTTKLKREIEGIIEGANVTTSRAGGKNEAKEETYKQRSDPSVETQMYEKMLLSWCRCP